MHDIGQILIKLIISAVMLIPWSGRKKLEEKNNTLTKKRADKAKQRIDPYLSAKLEAEWEEAFENYTNEKTRVEAEKKFAHAECRSAIDQKLRQLNRTAGSRTATDKNIRRLNKTTISAEAKLLRELATCEAQLNQIEEK